MLLLATEAERVEGLLELLVSHRERASTGEGRLQVGSMKEVLVQRIRRCAKKKKNKKKKKESSQWAKGRVCCGGCLLCEKNESGWLSDDELQRYCWPR